MIFLAAAFEVRLVHTLTVLVLPQGYSNKSAIQVKTKQRTSK